MEKDIIFFRIAMNLTERVRKGKMVSGQVGEDADFSQFRVVKERVCIVENTILK